MSKYTSLGKCGSVNPVKTCSSTGIDLARCGQQRDQFLVPISHLATCVPEWSVNGEKIAKGLVLQSLDEFSARHAVRPLNVKVGFKGGVKIMVPFYVVAELEDSWFGHFDCW